MADRFEGKIVLITGAAGALGHAMARAFAAEGACVILAAREGHEKDAGKLAKEVGNVRCSSNWMSRTRRAGRLRLQRSKLGRPDIRAGQQRGSDRNR